MRIIIEIEGDKVVARTDQPIDQLLETHSASIADAGSAPVELLRDFAIQGTALVDSASTGKKRSTSKQNAALNPLRAGEAIAREQLTYPTRQLSDAVEIIDAGGAPGPPRAAAKKPEAKRRLKVK